MLISELIKQLEHYQQSCGDMKVLIRLDDSDGHDEVYDVYIDHTDSGSEFDGLCLEPKDFN